jgi:hypothetical protein
VAIQETSDEKAEEAGLSENKARPSEFKGKLADSAEQRILPPPEEKIVSQEEKILADETFWTRLALRVILAKNGTRL